LLSAQIARCWNPPPGTTGSITVRFDLTQDGHVAGKPKANGLAAKGFADAAIHAVTFCEPYRLPPERYSDWQHAKVTLSTGN
jgi:colicin import membrane protein